MSGWIRGALGPGGWGVKAMSEGIMFVGLIGRVRRDGILLGALVRLQGNSGRRGGMRCMGVWGNWGVRLEGEGRERDMRGVQVVALGVGPGCLAWGP